MKTDSVTSPLISIVIPIYNESANIAAMLAALMAVAEAATQYRFEFIFVNDGSRDDSAKVLKKLAKDDPRVRPVELVRNFGKEIASSAGLHKAKGEAAIMIDGDLQHPPQLIHEFLQRWEAGDDVVIGRQRPNASYASFTKRFTARWFYRIINRISSVEITPHATDFRLLDRVVIDEFNRLTEHNRMTRGLIDWLGFKSSFIDFTPTKRANGSRNYSYRQLIRLATDSIVSLSFFPLRIAGYLGGFIVIISLPLMAIIGFNRLFQHNSLKFTGSATLATLMLFLIGIVLICLGLMALYIANIFNEVQNRPLYIEKRPRPKRL